MIINHQYLTKKLKKIGFVKTCDEYIRCYFRFGHLFYGKVTFFNFHKYVLLATRKYGGLCGPIYSPFGYWQSHYREVPRWEIFIEQELRFGLDLGRFGNFWGRLFSCFHEQKTFLKNILDGKNIFGIEWN